MDVLHGIESLPGEAGASVVTVGFFDGVHVGHQQVFRHTVALAEERGLTPVAVTFDRHPREVIAPGTEPRLLTTIERKASLIKETGIRRLVVLPFTEEFSKMTAEDFVERVLVRGLSAEHVAVGANFTFGHKALGTLGTLVELGAAQGFTAEAVPLLESGGRIVSSSSIRAALSDGDLVWPSEGLGRRFIVDGQVVSGAGRGTGLGFPTANLRTWPRLLLPGNGIYAGRAQLKHRWYTAAISVGTNPTFGTEPLHVEAYLLDFDGDARGEHLAVEFWERLRDEVKYDTTEALVAQIAEDVERTRAVVA
jgi:riboflavin kinase/FMN adenylyltransferase